MNTLFRLCSTGLIIMFLTSCDPAQLVYIRNHTNNSIELEVRHSGKYIGDTSTLQIKYTGVILEEIKPNSYKQLNDSLCVQEIDEFNYAVEIPAHSTSLFEPIGILETIKHVIIRSANGNDTLNFQAQGTFNLKSGRRLTYIHKGFSRFIFDYK